MLLQILRAAAALAVTAHHVLHEPYGGAAGAGLISLPWEAGVNVFFVISGFVMVHSSSRLFGAPGGRRVFLTRRLARIVPLYWVTTTLFLVVLAVLPSGINSPRPGLAEVLASYAFVPWQRADGMLQPVYSLGWTLNYEMFFYVVFALFLPLRREWAVASVALVLAVSVLLGVAVAPAQPALIVWSDPVVLHFVFGMGLALATAHRVILPAAARLLLAGAGLALLVWMPANWAEGIRFAPGAVMLVAAAVLGPDPRLHSTIGAGLARLGDASYALYLTHPFVLRAVTILWSVLRLQGPVAAAAASVAAFVCAMVVSVVIYTVFEARVTRALAGRWARRPVLAN